MITIYGNKINFNELMKKLSQEIHIDNLPVINRIKEEGEYAYQVLISTVLSSRTKDEVTAKASKRLFSIAMNLERLSQLSEREIAELIYPVGFYRVKSKNIKKIAMILLKEYKGKIPNKLEGLLALPGVGRKTANLVLGIAFEINAITVDIHVHRISNRLGIVNTKKPIETERDLQKILPERYWISFNTYLVAHGQTICKPITPACSQCKIFSLCQRIGINKSN